MNTFPSTGKYRLQIDYSNKIYLTDNNHTQYTDRDTYGYMFRINNVFSINDEYVDAHDFYKYIDTKDYEPLILLYCYGNF